MIESRLLVRELTPFDAARLTDFIASVPVEDLPLFTLAMGAANRPLPFLLGAVPMMVYLELTLRMTRPSRQA